MKKKELTLYVLAVIFLCGYILFSKRDDIRNFFREKQPNTIEINPFSPVLAVFSFQAGEPCHIIKTFSHYTL